MTTPPTVPLRATALLGYPEFVAHLGGDADALLLSVGIDPVVVGAADRFVDYFAFIRLLDRSAATLERPLFGLELSQAQTIETLGAVAAVARCAPTVIEAAKEIVRYVHHYSPAVSLALDLDKETLVVTYDLNLPAAVKTPQIIDLIVGLSINFLRYLAERDLKPRIIDLCREPPADRAQYQRLLRCKPNFSQALNRFGFALDDLNAPIRSADGFLRELVVHHIGQEFPHHVDRLAQVRALATRLLPVGQCTLETIAGKLILHPRTLQRQLRQQGTTFQALVDEVRREQAANYLRIPNMPAAKIADMLGFQEQSSFNKACMRWWRASPGQYRQQLLER